MDEVLGLRCRHAGQANPQQRGDDAPEHGLVGEGNVHGLPGQVAALRFATDCRVMLGTSAGGCDPKWNTCPVAGGVELAQEVGVHVVLAAAGAGEIGELEVSEGHLAGLVMDWHFGQTYHISSFGRPSPATVLYSSLVSI